MLNKLDANLKAAHQWLLDKTQIDNNRAVDLATYAICVMALIRCLVRLNNGITDWHDALGLLLFPSTVYVAYYLASMRNVLKMLSWPRLLFFFFLFIPTELTALGIALQLGCLFSVMQLYFMACDKPKPPKRKTHYGIA